MRIILISDMYKQSQTNDSVTGWLSLCKMEHRRYLLRFVLFAMLYTLGLAQTSAQTCTDFVECKYSSTSKICLITFFMETENLLC